VEDDEGSEFQGENLALHDRARAQDTGEFAPPDASGLRDAGMAAASSADEPAAPDACDLRLAGAAAASCIDEPKTPAADGLLERCEQSQRALQLQTPSAPSERTERSEQDSKTEYFFIGDAEDTPRSRTTVNAPGDTAAASAAAEDTEAVAADAHPSGKISEFVFKRHPGELADERSSASGSPTSGDDTADPHKPCPQILREASDSPPASESSSSAMRATAAAIMTE